MKQRPSRFVLILVLLAAGCAAFPWLPQHAQSDKQSARRFLRASEHGGSAEQTGDGFIIFHNGNEVTCRQMTAREEQELLVEGRQADLHELANRHSLQAQTGLKIMLRGTQQLENFPQAKEAFLRAAAKWEAIIQTPITVVIDVDYGPTFFGSAYGAGTIGSTAPQRLISPNGYAGLRTALLGQATSPQQTNIYNALPDVLLTDLGTTSGVTATSPQLRALGVIAPVADPIGEQAQFGLPPAIGFNSAFTFDFDPSNGIEAALTDFEIAALHEIGHALGFLSDVGAKETTPARPLLPTIWDFFRFRPGGLRSSDIGSAARLQVAGGEQVYFNGESEFGLSTSANNQTGGDGRQGSHWKDDSLTGQYVGVMDPTIPDGFRGVIAAADLTALNYFGYKINPSTPVGEVLSVDDNTREAALALTNAVIVNRFTPARYPAKLEALRVLIPPTPDGSSPTGQPLRIVVFVDANRTGQPPANPTLLVDRTIEIPVLSPSRFIEVMLPEPPTINAGDIYVGVQSANANILIAADSTTPRNASFVSTDNGANFQPLRNAADRPVNFIARAIFSANLESTPTPAATAISPAALEPGAQPFTLYAFGKNFQPGSVVRWNGADRVTTFQSGAELQAQITAADVAAAGTARVTVFTPSGGESAGFEFKITADKPAPALTRLAPFSQARGGGAFNLDVFGVSLTPQSVVRWNGQDRTTTFVNSTQLRAEIPTTDLSAASNNRISVFTPGPGGGQSNEVNFAVVACSFSLNATTQTIASTGATTGVLLNTDSPCGWTAMTDAPWITINRTGGMGKSVIDYVIAPNTGATVRTATVNIGGRIVTIRQRGRASSVSAASFATRLAPQAIAAVFGANLANTTQAATAQPLPTSLAGTTVRVTDARGTERLAPLFFVSPEQVNFLVPAGTANGTATVLVTVDGTSFADGPLIVGNVAPALFAANANGRGVAAGVVLRIKADGAQSFEALARFDEVTRSFIPVPIDFGDETDQLVLLLFGTGVRGRSALEAVQVTLGDIALPVQFAGAQGGFTGLDQLNVALPRSLQGRGEVTINCTADGQVANAVTVNFK